MSVNMTFDKLLHEVIYSYGPLSSSPSFASMFGLAMCVFIITCIVCVAVFANSEADTDDLVLGIFLLSAVLAMGSLALPVHGRIDNIIFPHWHEKKLSSQRVLYENWMKKCHSHECEILMGDDFPLRRMKAYEFIYTEGMSLSSFDQSHIPLLTGVDVVKEQNKDILNFNLISISKTHDDKYVGFIKVWSPENSKKFGIYQIDMGNLLLRFRYTPSKSIQDNQIDLDQVKKNFENSVGK